MRNRYYAKFLDSYVDELDTHKKKLRQFRTEAIRTGFKKSLERQDYRKIITVVIDCQKVLFKKIL